MPELEIVKGLVELLGPVSAVLLISVWLWIYQRDKKRDPRNDYEATAKAREAIARIDTHIEHIVTDIDELKRDVKETNVVIVRHLQDHSR